MANKKTRLFLIIFLAAILFCLGANQAFALETKYPKILGLPEITNSSKIEDVATYFFGFGIYVVGFLSIISFVIGAVGLIVSAESPERSSNARDRMKGAILGLILTLVSFLIINTINTSLATPYSIPIGAGGGVVYFNGSDADVKPAPDSVQDTSLRGSDLISAGYGSIKYICPPEGGPRRIVIKYPGIGFTDDPGYPATRVERLMCGGSTDISKIASFVTFNETAGVYYYLQPNCQGLISSAAVGDQDELPFPFKGNVKSIGIVPSLPDTYYGVILHKNIGVKNGGLCSGAIVSTRNDPNFCYNIDFPASSASVFVWNKNFKTSGDGVVLFSRPYGWNTGSYAGCFAAVDTPSPDTCKNNAPIGGQFYESAGDLTFDYTGIKITPEDITSHKTFRESPGSIQIKGKYLVSLFSIGSDASYCQVFKTDVSNLNVKSFVPSGASIDKVYILPIKD